jgi:hypothetical protein
MRDAIPVINSGIGVQELHMTDICACASSVETYGFRCWSGVGIDKLAENDGLSLVDFKAWFKGYDLSKPMAIIHFINFRY